MKIFLILFLIILSGNLNAQSISIIGSIKSKVSKKPISGASVFVKSKDNIVHLFSIADNKGNFVLSKIDSLNIENYTIEISAIGYKSEVIRIDKKIRNYDILLEDEFILMDSVIVKSVIPIKRTGDTLSYIVSSFQREEDRTIGDVIKRLPGMSVSENGQISYNGKTISNLYIQGDDLMDGRYGLATKSINKNMIKSIDVLQNFQPIKILQDKTWSNEVAVNLILKDENSVKLAGQTNVGGGYPKLYDANSQLMLFNKKLKFLNSIKINNNGINYKNDFKLYTQELQLQNIDNNRPSKLLSLAVIDNPDINERLYYNNKSIALNLNNLYNTKDSIQIKTNIQAFKDENTFLFKNDSKYFLSSDTFYFNQQQQVYRENIATNIAATINVNKYNRYINNKFNLLAEIERDAAELNFNKNSFSQNISNKIKNISNDFTWLPVLKNSDLLSVKWNIDYYNIKQYLNVNSSIDSLALNNGKNYRSVLQEVELPSIFSNFNLSYIIGKKRDISQVYDLGLISERQNNISGLFISQLDNSITKYADDFGNNLFWKRNKLYLSGTYSFENKSFKANLSLPFFFQAINVHQKEYSYYELNNRFYLNPKFTAQVYTGSEDYLNISLNYNNNFSNINSVYRGLLLRDYRTLQKSLNAIQETYNTGSGITYNFRRTLSLLFITTGLKYNRISANTISNTILSKSIQQTQTINFNNHLNTILANSEMSKYIFYLKSKINITSFWTRNYSNLLINNEKFKYSNDVFTISFLIDAKVNERFSFTYNNIYLNSISKQIANTSDILIKNRLSRFENIIKINYAFKNTFFQLSFNSIKYNQKIKNNFYFFDILYRKSFKKVDLSIQANNLLNYKKYNLFNVNSNMKSESIYDLRGRLISGTFSFNF